MKYLFLILILLTTTVSFSQANDSTVCFFGYVEGEVRKPSDKMVATGDTIKFRDVQQLKYVSNGSKVIVYHPILGSFLLSQKEMERRDGHENFLDFVSHLLKIKGTKISLSSRGGCECSAPQSCFFTDTALNDKVLLVDSLSFVADESLFAADGGFYFLQKDTYGGGRLINRLRMNNGIVYIYPKDLVFKDSSNAEMNSLKLILYTQKNDVKKSDLVSIVKFKPVTQGSLKTYYALLQKAMTGRDKAEVYDSFCKDVYIFFGKPNECQLNKIINDAN